MMATEDTDWRGDRADRKSPSDWEGTENPKKSIE